MNSQTTSTVNRVQEPGILHTRGTSSLSIISENVQVGQIGGSLSRIEILSAQSTSYNVLLEGDNNRVDQSSGTISPVILGTGQGVVDVVEGASLITDVQVLNNITRGAMDTEVSEFVKGASSDVEGVHSLVKEGATWEEIGLDTADLGCNNRDRVQQESGQPSEPVDKGQQEPSHIQEVVQFLEFEQLDDDHKDDDQATHSQSGSEESGKDGVDGTGSCVSSFLSAC